MIEVSVVRPGAAPTELKEAVQELIGQVDDEFVPPLSCRLDTIAMATNYLAATPGIRAYCDAMHREWWIVARQGMAAVGLISFLAHATDSLLAEWSPSLYATTVAVAPRARRAGIATALYDRFEIQAQQRAVPFLTTRTWTGNHHHLNLLLKRGFREVVQVPNERGTGIGSVYLACRANRWRAPSED